MNNLNIINQYKKTNKMSKLERILELIKEGDGLFLKRDLLLSHLKYKEALKIALITKNTEIQKEIEGKINKVENAKDIEIKKQIEIIEEEALNFRGQKKFLEAFEVYETILTKANKMYNSIIKDEIIRRINDEIHILEVEQLPNLEIQGVEIERMNKVLKNYIIKIKDLKNQLKLNESINLIDLASNIIKNLAESKIKTKFLKEINRLNYEIKILKIKNKIKELSNQYGRLKLRDIAEECDQQEDLVLNIINEMIESSEINVKYFDGTKSVVFNQEVRLDDITNKTELKVKLETSETALEIKREYEFIGGQIRFKIGLKNKSGTPLTNFKILLDIPDALKWIMHEPSYERRGDTILFSKLGINEKKAISLYLEPINCLESPINAIISYFDVKDRPQTLSMEPKMISITCPIFFTREEANLARVKSLQRTLNHRDKKILPIINPEKASLIFSTILSVLGEYDIKLINKDYSEKEQFGEAWYYGITKVKQNRHVIYILIDAKNKTIELVVSADDEGQITSFLAEISNGIRQQLIEQNVISYDDKFYNIGISVLSEECPYCGTRIPTELVQNYREGTSIECNYCHCKLLKS